MSNYLEGFGLGIVIVLGIELTLLGFYFFKKYIIDNSIKNDKNVTPLLSTKVIN